MIDSRLDRPFLNTLDEPLVAGLVREAVPIDVPHHRPGVIHVTAAQHVASRVIDDGHIPNPDRGRRGRIAPNESEVQDESQNKSRRQPGNKAQTAIYSNHTAP